MSNEAKEKVNFWTTQILRGSVAIIAFFLVNYWQDFQQVKVEIKETREMVQNISTKQSVSETRFINLMEQVRQNTTDLKQIERDNSRR